MPSSTRKKLIEVAGDLFYTTGFQAVGLDQILNTVGITKTAFYKHFDSKTALILAVIEDRDQRDVREAIAEMRRRGGSDPRAQILALFDILADWFREPQFRGCLFMNAATEFPSPRDPIHRAAAAHAEHLSAELLLRVQAAGLPEPQRMVRQLMLLVSGAIAARHAGGMVDAALTARCTAEALLRFAVAVAADASDDRSDASSGRPRRRQRSVG